MNNVECNGLKAENPDLSRFYKSRSRDSSLIETAKKMLVHGYSPGKTSLLLRLPYDLVKNLYDNSWNPRCRKVMHTSQYATKRMARMYFDSGAMLAKICSDLQMPLFTVVTLLKREGITEKEMASRMPDHTDPLFVAYRETVARKQKNPQRRSPRLHY
ncbi:hypothetical protein [Enterobacter cloacae]|uniref:hypothetical protein n=1 Tax=Enterobacter cloacae TaxID=550 RepID=UPI0020750EFA|nr:hypothetical protein [Enterobacter cloacae]MCM7108918.1 hypothetical protein [Enterobacter cloacae]